MAYHYDKSTGDIIVDGFDQGIAVSPHKGIANMQAVNISTETGEVMCSYSRLQQTQTNATSLGTFVPNDSSRVDLSAGWAGAPLTAGVWITIDTSSITGITSGTKYYVLTVTNGGGSIQLATTYGGVAIAGIGATGTATFSLTQNVGKPIASTTETYSDGSGNTQYRYYVLDNTGLVWVLDTSTINTAIGLTWFLPDPYVNYFGSAGTPTGICVLNGWVMVFGGNAIWCKTTDNLANTTSSVASNWVAFSSGYMNARFGSTTPHFAFIGHQSTAYFTDSNFVGSIFPNSATATSPNIFSYAKYTTSTTTGTITALIGGTAPTAGSAVTRVPAAFFTSSGGTVATTLNAGGTQYASAIFYIDYSRTAGTFQVFAAQSGGSALDITTGVVGTQYFNTFAPVVSAFTGTFIYSPQALTLPFYETSQSLAEIGNQVIIGCKSNTIYQWDQVSPQPSGFIALPENNAVNIITVNNMGYVFAGSKGNVYITNGSTASLVLSVPDYCAGIAGTASTYVEPYFTWGGSAFIRGRVYFSILDQTSAKAGNCGGVWSFVPTQNFFIGQDTGLALRIENQNSYGSYSGYATVILGSQNQTANSPQYWSGWQSSITSPVYGIDFTGTSFTTNASIETDLIPIGTMLNKNTGYQIEYKLAAPLASSESVSLSFRQNGTASYTSCGTAVIEGSSTIGTISGYFAGNFEKSQWVQFKIGLVASSVATNVSSGTRLTELRIR